jgi:hypothetical protein
LIYSTVRPVNDRPASPLHNERIVSRLFAKLFRDCPVRISDYGNFVLQQFDRDGLTNMFFDPLEDKA